MSDATTSIAGILGQQDFDAAVSRWVEVINKPDSTVLQDIFQSDNQLVTGVGFTIERIAQLVATIGAVRVKARFIINPVVKGGKPQFLVALFAVDALDARVSSYYLPEHLYTQKLRLGRHTSTPPTTIHKNQVSNVLAQRWVDGWAGVPEVKTSYFDSHYGPLRGYTFELDEFAAVFHHLSDLNDKLLRLSYVLHDFYQPDPTGGDMQAFTFALALRLDHLKVDGDEDVTGKDDPALNFAHPCPPTC